MRKIVTVMAVAALTACTIDSYDTGTGAYSLTQADFVEAHSDGNREVDYVLTDDGERLTVSSRIAPEWMETADTLYRAVLYYNKVSSTEAKPMALSLIPTLLPAPKEKYDEVHTDPVKFESLWISGNGRYLNIGLYLKVGQIDEEAELHTIGLIDDGTVTNSDGTRTARLRLYHDQGDVPEYYSSKYYVSIPCNVFDTDSVSITLNTYDGPVERRLRLNQ